MRSRCGGVAGRERQAGSRRLDRRCDGGARLSYTPDVLAARILFAGRAMEGERKLAGYAFKHDLTQKVAYWSELCERRARLHGAVARALEAQGPDERDRPAALIAHHLEEAGRSAPATPG